MGNEKIILILILYFLFSSFLGLSNMSEAKQSFLSGKTEQRQSFIRIAGRRRCSLFSQIHDSLCDNKVTVTCIQCLLTHCKRQVAFGFNSTSSSGFIYNNEKLLQWERKQIGKSLISLIFLCSVWILCRVFVTCEDPNTCAAVFAQRK